MALVKFVSDVAANYAALAVKDPDTLYFISDEQRLYKGDTPYGGFAIVKDGSLPAVGKLNTIYIDTSKNGVYVYTGAGYETIVEPKGTITKTIAQDTQGGLDIPTIKAVYDFVTAEIAKVDAGGINDTITALEERIEDVENNKADAATTLAGYGITDAYTKIETATEISKAVANADHLKREIVTALPTDEISESTIYMVEITDGSGNQKYEEFMYINNDWEKIGDSAVDLTGYATETYVGTKVSDAITAITNAYEAADQTILNSAADYADSLADNYATAAQGALADSAIQTVAEGSANGTIAVDGTDVAVHGLGTAAYTEATAYDAAGSANTALTTAKKYTDDEIVKALSWNEIEL